MKLIDPVEFVHAVWPHIQLYDKQKEILYSLRDNVETVVPAGNKLGKDFIAALGALWFFCSRRPARVVTTSVKYDQLNDVLWGEIRRALQTAKINLPIKYNHLHIRQVDRNGEFVPLAELVGQVTSKSEGLLGRHLPFGPEGEPTTLVIFDEASGIDDEVITSTLTWSHRRLFIGNCFECQNRFRHAVEGKPDGSDPGGDKPHPSRPSVFLRKVIPITAEDSPNVRLARWEIEQGREPSNRIVVPGVKGWEEYQTNRSEWDAVLQTIGLDAQWYKGADVLMFPPEWLNRAAAFADGLPELKSRKAECMGVDTAEGVDKTAWSVVDRKGLLTLISMPTPDTTKIIPQTRALMRQYQLEPHQVVFDAGGGGKQFADIMRSEGQEVRTIFFGEAADDINKLRRGIRPLDDRKEEHETRYVFLNRRAEMYGLVRDLIDPIHGDSAGFGIPAKYSELRRQLAPIPLQYDREGRVYLPPKNRKNPDSDEVTLRQLLGCSPDEADSFVLAVYGMTHKAKRRVAGAVA